MFDDLLLRAFLSSVLFLFVFLFDSTWLTLSFPFFLSTIIHVSLSWILSLLLPCPCLLFIQKPHPLFLPISLSVSLHYLSLSRGERSLTRSPWSSRVQWRESWVWWTTCPALSATTMRCPPGPASTAPTRRSIITRTMTHSLHFMCRTAQVITRKWKRRWCSLCCKFWLLKNPERLQILLFSLTHAKKKSVV